MQEPAPTIHCFGVLKGADPHKFRALAAGAKRKIAGKLFGYCLEEGLMGPAKMLAGAIGTEKAHETAWRSILSSTMNVRTTDDLVRAMSVANAFSAPPRDALTHVLLGAIQLACGTDGVFHISSMAEHNGLVNLGRILPKISYAAANYGWVSELKHATTVLGTYPAQTIVPHPSAVRAIVRWGKGF